MDSITAPLSEITDPLLLLRAIYRKVNTMPNRDELRSAIRDEVTEALNANSAERDQLRADLQSAIERADLADADKAAVQQAFDDYSASIDQMIADVREPGLYGQDATEPEEPTDPEAPVEPVTPEPVEPEPVEPEQPTEPVEPEEPGGVVF